MIKYLFGFLCLITSLFSQQLTWESPITLDSDTTNEIQLGLNNSGSAIAVWQEADGVFTKFSTDSGQSLSSTPTQIGVAGEANVRLTLNNSNQAIIVRLSSDTAKVVFSSDGGATFSSPTTGDEFTDVGLLGNVIINSAGKALILYRELGDFTVYDRRSSDGGDNWASIKEIDATPSNSTAPSLALNSSDKAIALFEKQSDNTFKTKRSTNAGVSWVDPTTDISGSGSSKSIVLNDSDQAIAIWASSGIQTSFSSDAGDNWTGVSLSANSSSVPKITLNNSGQAIATWIDLTASNHVIVKYSTNGGQTWLDPNGGEDISGASSSNPHVHINDNGFAIAVWKDTTTGNIYSKYSIDGGQTWQEATDGIDISSSTGSTPLILLNSSNKALSLWRGSAISLFGEFASGKSFSSMSFIRN